ncbi:unnamed protein product [Kuraishia capsulata CBS 1993]|uniref:Large ribosomal subunit protein mL40 n=1 Tax=Kuraishia capsulata CBS 1993 TaxID=1382522 RepID=W6MLM5_9ASCO|nr:uncharacterized protein KUCA_T00003379001 [Kuraishia capsulata CBS 1993]CDK27401.1 unnamed protein product [Kuraishia capsulata CBS 1993]
MLSNVRTSIIRQVDYLTSGTQLHFIRTKRKKAGSDKSEVRKLVTQLSVLSANRKQPKLLKFSNEDYVKHQVIQKSWNLYVRDKKAEEANILQKQYESIRAANEDLQSVSKELFSFANTREPSKRFPLELRVPTEYPPNQIWHHDYTPKVEKKK